MNSIPTENTTARREKIQDYETTDVGYGRD